MALNVNIRCGLQGNYTKVADGGTASFPITPPADMAISDGTGANQSDRYFFDTRSLTTGTTEDVDISTGITDVYGASLAFVELTYLRIRASTANTTNLTVGGDVNGFLFSTAAADTVLLTAGDEMVFHWPVAGKAVTAGTGDIIQVANSAGATATYDIEIMGRSA